MEALSRSVCLCEGAFLAQTLTPVQTRSNGSFKSVVLLQSHPIEDEAQHHPEICHKIPSSRSCLPRQPSLKDFSERAVEFTLIPLIHPQPPQHTNPPSPPCARGTCILFSNPQTSCIMHRVSTSAQRTPHQTSLLMASVLWSGGMSPLTFYNSRSIILFIFFAHRVPPPALRPCHFNTLCPEGPFC